MQKKLLQGRPASRQVGLGFCWARLDILCDQALPDDPSPDGYLIAFAEVRRSG